MSLKNVQKKHLRGLAHDLSPVVMIGDKGLTDNVMNEIIIALEHHELIKVRIRAERDERVTITEQIVAATRAEAVQSIGQILVLFRRNPKQPRISLPV
ncbi:MAG: ribosome assembly RNA-binding protein YhbY [Gammaproteobacteria bacterium]|nr:ribosome assembly RNA-binding protein YhbY [Gammaproteobacteria bacterium]